MHSHLHLGHIQSTLVVYSWPFEGYKLYFIRTLINITYKLINIISFIEFRGGVEIRKCLFPYPPGNKQVLISRWGGGEISTAYYIIITMQFSVTDL